MRIKSLLTAIMLLCINAVFAAPFFNVEKILTQPDGTKLHCFASGDEFYNRLHDADGYTIVQAENGYFVYATTDINGKIIPTHHIAGKTDPKTLGLKANIMISREDYQKKRDAKRMPEIKSDKNLNHGVYNNLVVFIKFKGDADLKTTKTEIDSMFNRNGYYDISMNNYFQKATYNQLSMDSYLYPIPEGNKIIAYEDIYPRNYYQPYNETTNPEGYTNQAEREFPLLKRAIEFIADQVPDTLNIDRDDDGFIDNVIFVVKGNVGDWADLLWPHMWSMYGEDAYINGKKVGTFNFQLETSSYFSTSTLCHEMSHSLGFPDLYHYYGGTSLSPSGPWDLMCGNSNPPQHSSTYMKYKYGTWIDKIPEIDYGTYTIEANSWEGGRRNCYKIPTSHPDQFYLLEYRNKSNFFEKGLPGSGLLIYRIDTRFHGCANYDGTSEFDEVYIFRPGGTYNKNGTINAAAFSADANRTVFNYDTDPYPFLNKNQHDLEFNICNISETGDYMTFTYCPIDTDFIPKNFDVRLNGFDDVVELSWDINQDAESYNLYRNDELIANVTENYYNDYYDGNTNSYYNYYVTSVSGDSESYRSNEKDIIVGEYCEYIVEMKSSGEHGWQGGDIRVRVDNDNIKDQYLTIYSGNESSKSILVPKGTKISLIWTSGWSDSECSFTITNNGDVVYTSGDLQEGLVTEFIADGVNNCVAPFNLNGSTSGNNIALKWNTKVESEGFTVVRDGEVIAEDVRACSFIDNDITESGVYHYCVKSTNSFCTSLPSDTISVSIMRQEYSPIVVNATNEEETVNLSWEAPSPKNGLMKYDDGTYLKNDGSNTHHWGIMIPADKLKLFKGSRLTSLEMFDACSANYTFKIYNGKTTHDSTLIYTETFTTNNVNEFVTFELSEEVTFNNEKNLWVIAKSSGASGMPIPCGNFVNDNNSCLIKAGTSWIPATDYNMYYSWLLRVHTSAGEGIDSVMKYNVYRNDALIASDIEGLTFTDNFKITEEVCYKVEGIADENTVFMSEEVCVKPNIEEDEEEEDTIYPIPTSDYLNINIADILNVKLFSITGAKVLDQDVSSDSFMIDMRKFMSGVYIIEITTKEEIITEKVVYCK